MSEPRDIPQSRTAPWTGSRFTVLVIAVLLLHVAAVGYFFLVYAPGARRAALAEWRGRLVAMADERREAIAEWVVERLADARVTAAYPSVVEMASTRTAADADALRPHLLGILETLSLAHHYRGMLVVGHEGAPVVTWPVGQPVSATLAAIAARTVADGRESVELVSLAGGEPVAVAAAPVIAATRTGHTGSRRAVAAVLLEVDPHLWLFPALTGEPSQSRTRESALVQEVGGKVVFLNPLRQASAAPFEMRRALAPGLAAAAALTAGDTFGAYVDYRDVPVFAATRSIAGTPWALVVKLDRSEVMAGVRDRLWTTAISGVAVLLALWGLAYGLWRDRRERYRRRASEAETRAATLLENARDMVVFTDREGRILDCNRAALAAYGYEREEMLRLGLADLRASEAVGALADHLREAASPEGVALETVHRRKAGATFPVEIVARGVEVDGRTTVVGVFRDITERKQAETRINRLNRLLRTISEINQLIVRQPDPDRLLADSCQIAVESGGYVLAWVGLAEAGGREVRKAAAHGPATGYLDAIRVEVRDVPLGRGPTGTAIREQRTVVANDWETDESVAPWRAAARPYSFRSSAAVPLRVGERVLGAFTVYSTDANSFDAETIGLLEELAVDIGYALDGIETARRRAAAEAALRESEERYRLLSEHSADVIWTLDVVTQRFTYVSPSVERLRGYTPEEVMAQPLEAALTPESTRLIAAELPRRVAAVEAGDEAARVNVVQVSQPRRDGSIVETEIMTTLLCDERGRVTSVLGITRDITERRRAERALRESEERFVLFMERLPAMVFIKDEASRLLYLNRHMQDFFGFEDALGKTTEELLPPALARTMVADDRRALAEGLTFVTEEVADRAGERHVFETYKFAIPRQDQPPLLGGIAIEVTGRVLAEEALRESEERLNLALESTGVGLWDWHVATGRLEHNEAWAAMLGYRIEEIAGEADPWQSRVHPDDLPAVTADLERHLRGELPVYENEHRLRTKSGAWIWVLDRGRVVERDAAGKPVRVIGTQQDITARRASEEANRRLAAAVDQAAELIVITDPSGVIEYVNPAFTAVTGYTAAEAIGQNPRMLKSGRHDESFYREMWATLLRDDVWHGHLVNRRKDGALFEEDATFSPVRDGGGKVINYVAVGRDVTAEMQLEDQLRHAQKMEALGRVAGGVAHDFNNLLQAMLSAVQVLGLPGDTTGASQVAAKEIEELVRRGASLARQLLLFARRSVTRPERLDLNELLRTATHFLRRLVRENVRIEEALADVPLPVDGDRGQLEQVLTNLVVNGADAMPDGGVLAVRTGFGDEGTVWFEIADTGVGMSNEVREKIFEPFFTTKPPGRGTGLGLAVVHGIVAQHGGRVEVDSAPGLGSRFRVVLPKHASGVFGKARIEARDARPVEGGKESILVVEDNAEVRRLMTRLLERLGYTVTAVGSGEEAGLLTSDAHFDLLISDVMLPGASGIDVAVGLRERWPGLNVILMSGYAEDEIVRHNLTEGRFRFLQKPVDLETLAREVRAALGE